ncbi:MAG: preprotein translocase subunit SecG [Bacteroidetes bacterium]|nr:preprotein translocase subunit SecG [Bacteroidota bacterium]
MTLFFLIMIILACVILSLIVLVQNPKGGGLAGNIAGLSNQFMGVKQTTDVLEKGTWIFVGLIAVLCMISVWFMPGDNVKGGVDRINQATGTSIPAPTKTNTDAKGPVTAPPASGNSSGSSTPPNTTPGSGK